MTVQISLALQQTYTADVITGAIQLKGGSLISTHRLLGNFDSKAILAVLLIPPIHR